MKNKTYSLTPTQRANLCRLLRRVISDVTADEKSFRVRWGAQKGRIVMCNGMGDDVDITDKCRRDKKQAREFHRLFGR